MNTEGVTVAEGSLEDSETVTPPAGAGIDSVIGNAADWFVPTVTLAGSTIVPCETDATVMFAVALAIFAEPAFAVIVAEPAPTPVSVTLALVAPAPNVTLAGTVAALALLELKVTVKGVGTDADRLSVMFCVVPLLTVELWGEKISVPFTCTA